APDRRSLLLPRAPDLAQVHRERRGRPVLSAGFLPVLLRRPSGPQIPALRPQREPFARGLGCRRQRPGVLPGGPERYALADVLVEGAGRRLDPREYRDKPPRSQPLAGDTCEGGRLPPR